MRYIRFLKTRKAAVDIGIVAAVFLFFIAGVLFESRRSGGRLPDVGAETVLIPTPAAGASDADPGLTDSLDTAAGAEEAASAQPTPLPVPAGTPNPDAVGQAIFLELSGIENESVIEESQVTVTGSTTPDALLSVNGEVVTVELDGTFTVDIELEPGPNFIEFVSSNLRGQETSRVISVVSVQ